MNRQNSIRLREALQAQQRAKYPNVPEHYNQIKMPSDDSANGLTKCIIQFLLASGHFAERISNQGQYRDNTKEVSDVLGRKYKVGSGQWTKGQGTLGTADISAQIRRLGDQYAIPVKIEVKFGRDTQSEDQKVYAANVQQAGGVYMIARTFDQFIEWYDSFMDEMVIKRMLQ